MSTGHHSDSRWRALAKRRVTMGRDNGEPCARCGLPIDYRLSGRHKMGATADHSMPLAYAGDLLPALEDLQVMHRACNAKGGAAIVNSRRKSGIPNTQQPIAFPRRPLPHPAALGPIPPQGQPNLTKGKPTLTDLDRDPRGTPEDWAPFDVPWLADLLPPPEDVAWPRHMTAIHPRAVGSLGVAAQVWIEVALGIRLRWWQALAIRRQLEVDADGLLVWFTVVESAPRRSGKSTRLRGSALWRSVQGAAFGEPQTTLLTGKDLPVVREVHRRAWPWAEANGCSVRKQNGNEEIEWPDLSRWLVRSVFAVYGYDVGYGMVDEGWGVTPTAVDDGLEPALLERAQPQLLLTSTGHPNATRMMTTRRDAALDQLDDPTDTLLLDWGAPPGVEIADRRAWRLASPYWSAARERLLESALRRILAGNDEASGFEGLDPEASFRAQYLNEWPKRGARVLHWLAPEAVARCGADEVTFSGAPLVGAIEVALDGSQWSAAVSDGLVCATLVGVTLPEAVAWLTGHAPHEIVANSAAAKRLPNDWLPIHHVTVGEISAATQTLKDAISAASIRWDNPADLEAQFGRVVTAPGPAGPKIADRVSRGNVEAVYALSWAYFRVVTEQPQLPMIY